MCAINSSAECCGHPVVLPALWWWDDRAERTGPENMAVDEWLLASRPDRPVLRAYRWTSPAISIGFGESSAAARQKFPAAAGPVVRRWTGGGLVCHGHDQTYTVVLPREAAPQWQNSARVYGYLHGALAAALRELGLTADCVGDGLQIPGSSCFEAPVRHDVLVAGRKVAGAGQRRTRDGLLHQGSLQGAAALPEVVPRLAGIIATVVDPLPASRQPLPLAIADLARIRYDTPAWTDLR